MVWKQNRTGCLEKAIGQWLFQALPNFSSRLYAANYILLKKPLIKYAFHGIG
jgi:hypothetical protein